MHISLNLLFLYRILAFCLKIIYKLSFCLQESSQISPHLDGHFRWKHYFTCLTINASSKYNNLLSWKNLKIRQSFSFIRLLQLKVDFLKVPTINVKFTLHQN
jgi:hypothetical protein